MKLNMEFGVHHLIIRLRTFFGGVTYLEFWGHGQHMVAEWLVLDLSTKVSDCPVMFQKSGHTIAFSIKYCHLVGSRKWVAVAAPTVCNYNSPPLKNMDGAHSPQVLESS